MRVHGSRFTLHGLALAVGGILAGCGGKAESKPPAPLHGPAPVHAPAAPGSGPVRGPKISIPGLTEPLRKKPDGAAASVAAPPAPTPPPAPVSPPPPAPAPPAPAPASPAGAPPAAAAAPTEVSFPLLESVTKPIGEAKTLDDLPKEVRDMDGKEVLLMGHLLVPYASGTVREFLIAKYPWDGCCMGVPPTIYTAVEVVLAKGQRLSDPTAPLVTVRGRLSVKPQFIDGYPTGLYKIEEAKEVLP
ncbi:MAG: DUF3299 domain-containing protein [Planctomycetales bacterium]|nr:DUF3299 domain-containing protein [Planctomycetales bacterium]